MIAMILILAVLTMIGGWLNGNIPLPGGCCLIVLWLLGVTALFILYQLYTLVTLVI